jgi:DMSO/TMAO reductase YedYZ molybdopterin-dependent catalytic subunit
MNRTRRELLKMTPLAAAGVLFSERARNWITGKGVELSDSASGLLFRSAHLAPTYGNHELTPLERYPLNSYLVHDPDVDLDTWRLDVSGMVSKAGEYTLDAIRALPKIVQNTQHVCIEGWTVIGNFGGARASDVLALAGADPTARFLEVRCADDYYESLDMESIRHPQSLFCYEMYGQPLPREHGAPLRLIMPTKLGYKQAKYITSLNVANVLPARLGYWEDQG